MLMRVAARFVQDVARAVNEMVMACPWGHLCERNAHSGHTHSGQTESFSRLGNSLKCNFRAFTNYPLLAGVVDISRERLVQYILPRPTTGAFSLDVAFNWFNPGFPTVTPPYTLHVRGPGVLSLSPRKRPPNFGIRNLSPIFRRPRHTGGGGDGECGVHNMISSTYQPPNA